MKRLEQSIIRYFFSKDMRKEVLYLRILQDLDETVDALKARNDKLIISKIADMFISGVVLAAMVGVDGMLTMYGTLTWKLAMKKDSKNAPRC